MISTPAELLTNQRSQEWSVYQVSRCYMMPLQLTEIYFTYLLRADGSCRGLWHRGGVTPYPLKKKAGGFLSDDNGSLSETLVS